MNEFTRMSFSPVMMTSHSSHFVGYIQFTPTQSRIQYQISVLQIKANFFYRNFSNFSPFFFFFSTCFYESRNSKKYSSFIFQTFPPFPFGSLCGVLVEGPFQKFSFSADSTRCGCVCVFRCFTFCVFKIC